VTGSEADLLASIALVPSSAQSLVKLASVYMELGNPEQAFECFKKAIDQDPTDPDVYYHRGQGQSDSLFSSTRLSFAIFRQSILL
jgi:mitochondrial import receptor subunit TOM70